MVSYLFIYTSVHYCYAALAYGSCRSRLLMGCLLNLKLALFVLFHLRHACHLISLALKNEEGNIRIDNIYQTVSGLYTMLVDLLFTTFLIEFVYTGCSLQFSNYLAFKFVNF